MAPQRNVVKITNENGDVVSHREYNAWGVMMEDDVSPGGESNQAFQPNWEALKDSDKGDGRGPTLYMTPSGRLYNTKIGRFLQPDPKFKIDTTRRQGIRQNAAVTVPPSNGIPETNRYIYANNNPINVQDPTGLAPILPTLPNPIGFPNIGIGIGGIGRGIRKGIDLGIGGFLDRIEQTYWETRKCIDASVSELMDPKSFKRDADGCCLF